MKDERKQKTIHRVEKTKDYSVICNHGPHDGSLTWGAKGLLAHMLTRPDDWDFHNEELARHSPESISVVKRLIKELKDKGYIQRRPIKDPKTHKIERWETILFEKPAAADPDDPGDEKPEGGNCASGSNVENTPEVQKPHSGNPDGVESHAVGNVPLLNTDISLNTDTQNIPIGEQPEPLLGKNVPDMQKATAIFFLKMGGKKELSDDDKVCLNMLFKLHTPAAIQQQILKSFERLQKNGSVVVEFNGQDYTIQRPEKMPVRYIYNSMKNWNSLKNTKGGGQGGSNRANSERDKNYTKGAASNMFR